MQKSPLWLPAIAALLGATIVAIPQAVQAQCTNGSCEHPVARVNTIYHYKTVPRISNINQYHHVTHTSYRDISKTKYYDVHKIRYNDITHTNYVRHINRIVSVTRVQPIVHVHSVTVVHPQVVTRVHTQMVPRVHVAVIPRVHNRTVVQTQNQYASETRVLPTRTAMVGSRTVMAGARATQVASNTGNGQQKLMDVVRPRKQQGMTKHQ
jgi:hypothetical protein